MKKIVILILFFNWSILSISQDTMIVNLIGMNFKKIIPGRFIMGTFKPTVSMVGFFSDDPEPANDPIYIKAQAEAINSYKEGFVVNIENEYYIGQSEVSQYQWQKIMGYNPSHFNEKYTGQNTDEYPVENISVKECKIFIKKLNKLDKGKYKYRIPSEIEWEYAARAGNQDDVSWTEIWKTAVTGSQLPTKKNTKIPNAWGLYDMLGNVWEWTSDGYNEKIFADPSTSNNKKVHVIKGSCFYGDVKNATYMTHGGASGKRYDIGLRIVMEKVK